MKNDSLERCVCKKREGREKAKDSIVRGRKRERERRRKIWRETGRRSENRDAIAEKSILREKEEGREL